MATSVTDSLSEKLSGVQDTDSDGEAKIKKDESNSEKNSGPESVKSVRTESEREEKASSGSRTPDSGRMRSSRGSATDRKSTDTRPKSTDSSGRPKSSCSGDIGTGTKTRRQKRQKAATDAHSVTFTVVICVAIPSVGTDEPEGMDPEKLRQMRKRLFEAPRAQNYYHLQYSLVPDDDEVMKTDVVTYGPAAKIYMERHDPKVIKTWQSGDVTWVAWSHSRTLMVTSELLLKLFNHTMELRIWDTKDKVGTRARFDRPKLFKIPQSKHDEEKGVKGIVLRQSRNFANLQPKKSSGIRPLPTQISFQRSEPNFRTEMDQDETDDIKEKSLKSHDTSSSRQSSLHSVKSRTKPSATPSPPPHTLVAVPSKDSEGHDVRSSFSRLGRLAGEDAPSPGARKTSSGVFVKPLPPVLTQKVKQQEPSIDRQQLKSEESLASSKAHLLKESFGARQKHRRKKSEDKNQIAAENVRKNGICVIPIRMAKLFAGLQSLTSRLHTPIPGMEDVFVSVSLDGPLMSDQHQQELNPMIIKIHSATNMPHMPIDQEDLKSKCLPVHCKYKFFKESSHVSFGREHSNNIYWDDVNVVLAGYLDKSELREYLSGPPMEIEIHDRDRRPEHFKLKPSLFGDDLEDEKISNVGTVASRRTLYNPFKGREKPWDPFGIAKIDMSDFLLGQRYIYLKVPIQNCSLPDVLGYSDKQDGKLYGISGAVDGPVDGPLPPGHYVQSNTMLKVKVELSYPLITPDRVVAKQQVTVTPECPFGRIVFLFDYKNTALLTQLQNRVTSINALALELDDLPQHVVDAALSTYKLSIKQQSSKDLDILTGFQVMDGTKHMFVLEGLRDKCIHDVWQALPQPENSDVKVLYNSDLIFSERLYGPLDVDLCRVKLHEPLSDIISQPLLYIRDMVPKLCFGALIKLHELTKTMKLRDAVRNDLFPSAEMVVCMSKEFGVPLTQEDFEELQPAEEKMSEEHTVTHKDSIQRELSRTWEPIDNFNADFLGKLLARDEQEELRDFIKENIDVVQASSQWNRNSRLKNKSSIHADVHIPHNYSTQTLNSTELAKGRLRHELAKDCKTRYTYCRDYHHSMTVIPVNVDALKKAKEEDNRTNWQTVKGWTYPGMKTTLEANVHHQKPNSARSEELQEPWRENLLHVGLLQAPLDRDRLPWQYRQHDFELYQHGPAFFDPSVPITIHLAGKTLEQEKLEAIRKEYEDWKSRVVVSNPKPSFHRCLAATELNEQGQKASNQIAKLKGHLKDLPSKHSLKKHGLALDEIPPLSVVLNPSVDTVARESGLSVDPAIPDEGDEKTTGFNPGPYEFHGWNLERNKIPVHDYKHSLFESSKGSDFNVYHKNRAKIWKRPIKHLSDKEKDNHLFRIPIDRFNFLSPDKGDEIFFEPPNGEPTVSKVTAIQPTDSLLILDVKNNESITNLVLPIDNQSQIETVVN